MIRVRANRDTCSGFATCIVDAEDVFDLDDDGLVVVVQPLVSEDRLDAVRQASYDCPTDSVSFVEDSTSEE